jgi:signal transduction histidine kinase
MRCASFLRRICHPRYVNRIVDKDNFSSEELRDRTYARNSRRVHWLRIVMVTSLLATSGVLAYIAFYFFRNLEIQVFEKQFTASCVLLEHNINKNFQKTFKLTEELAVAVSVRARLSNSWPNATMPGFEATSFYRAQLLDYRAIAIWPFVTLEQKESFEAFAVEQVAQHSIDGSYSFQKYAWAKNNMKMFNKDSNGNVIPSTTSLNGALFPNMFAPIFNLYPSAEPIVGGAFMFNAMGESVRRRSLEYVLTYKDSTVTDIVQFINDPVYRPTTQLYVPITPVGDNSTLYGVAVITFSWDTFLANVLASYLVGLQVVLSSPQQTCTFTIDGNSSTTMKGDVHDGSFEYLAYRMTITQIGNSNTTYNLVAYPTHRLYQSYLSSNPINAMLIVVTISLVSVIVFLTYIYAVIEHEKHERAKLVREEADFTDFLAHEVRNPLSGIDACSLLILADLEKIKMKVSILAGHADTSVEAQHLSEELDQPLADGLQIKRCVQYIQNILDNTLDITKLKNGRLDIQLKTVFLRYDILDMAVVMLSAMKAPGVEVSIDCADDIYVIADPLRLTQVIVNLLNNAFKFCKKGIVKLKAAPNTVTKKVRISIEDTGPGIPLEHRSKLFSKYGQIAVRQGTGLGLALALVRDIY